MVRSDLGLQKRTLNINLTRRNSSGNVSLLSLSDTSKPQSHSPLIELGYRKVNCQAHHWRAPFSWITKNASRIRGGEAEEKHFWANVYARAIKLQAWSLKRTFFPPPSAEDETKISDR